MKKRFTVFALVAPKTFEELNPKVLVPDEVPNTVAAGLPKMLAWGAWAPMPNAGVGCPNDVVCPKVLLLSVCPKIDGAEDTGWPKPVLKPACCCWGPKVVY